MDLKERALKAHEQWGGKIEVVARCEVNSKDDLSVAYTPGVAEPCLKIKDDPSLSYTYTRRHNLVAVITDGTAVLGLGDIGPIAGMPVMEGKCALFKAFADVDAFPLCVASKDVDEIVRTIQLISGSFGGINLEDIAAPRCFEIERRLKEVCDIPVFHDDQHGTAVCCGAALINACRLTGRKVEDIKMVVNGCGAAAIAVTKFLMFLGVQHITMVERFGIVCEGDERLNPAQAEMAKVTPAAVTQEMSNGSRAPIVRSIMSTSSVNTSPAIGALKMPATAPAAPHPTRSMSVLLFMRKSRPRLEPMAEPVSTMGASAPTEPPKPMVMALAMTLDHVLCALILLCLRAMAKRIFVTPWLMSSFTT